jgi:hypothetical protein
MGPGSEAPRSVVSHAAAAGAGPPGSLVMAAHCLATVPAVCEGDADHARWFSLCLRRVWRGRGEPLHRSRRPRPGPPSTSISWVMAPGRTSGTRGHCTT